jgi:hypothetical protein
MKGWRWARSVVVGGLVAVGGAGCAHGAGASRATTGYLVVRVTVEDPAFWVDDVRSDARRTTDGGWVLRAGAGSRRLCVEARGMRAVRRQMDLPVGASVEVRLELWPWVEGVDGAFPDDTQCAPR